MAWTIVDSVASFFLGGYTGEFDIRRPDLGLRLHSAGLPPQSYLAVQFAEPSRVRAADCYARVDDLVLMYPQTAQRPFNVQLQYRVFAGGGPDTRFPQHADMPRPTAPGLENSLLIELWISNYTFSLDTHPEVDTWCFALPDDDASLLQLYEADGGGGDLSPCATADADGLSVAAAVLASHGDRASDAAVMVHPTDQIDSQLLVAGDASSGVNSIAVQMRIFGRFMEKGVIRRARLRLLVSPDSIDERTLLAHYADFAASPLPLTT